MSFLSKLAISGYTPCSFSDTDIWNMSQLMAHHWRTGAASRDCRRGRSHWLTLSGSTGDFCGFNGDCEDLKLHGTLPPFFLGFQPPNLRCFPVIQNMTYFNLFYTYTMPQSHRTPPTRSPARHVYPCCK